VIRFSLILFLGVLLTAQAQAQNAFSHRHGGGGGPPPVVAGAEQFVGPLAGWLCVRTLASGTCGAANGGYGTAAGNGSTDDTAAIQASLNSLGSSTPVLYFPPGTYKITAALTTVNAQFASVLGASPAPTCAGGVAEAGTVCIVWGGAANAKVMLDNQGLSYSRVDRITFNGNNTVGVLVSDNFNPGQNFNSANEYSDDVFINAGGTYNATVADAQFQPGPTDVACGFILGTTQLQSGGGCADIQFLRDHFTSGSTATNGLGLGNQNSGDVRFWYSTFTGKAAGLWAKFGDYHAFYNNFSASTLYDMIMYPNGEQTVMGNYSVGSTQFLWCPGFNDTAITYIERNTIINTSNVHSVECSNQGPTILIDNSISSCTIADGCSADNTTASVVDFSTVNTDTFSTGNTYTTGTANSCGGAGGVSVFQSSGTGRCHAVGDSVVAHFHPPPPTLPGTPPRYCASG